MKKTIEAAKTKEWNREFSSNIWEELMTLSKGTGYDFSGMNRKMLLEQNHGYRIPLPAEYHTDADVKKRYDKYNSSIQYAYPYDPHIDKLTGSYLKNMKDFNKVYGEWLEKNINEVVERTFNPAKVDENSAAPYDQTAKFTANVIGDPDKDMNALKNIALSPAEFSDLRHEYTKADGSKLLIIDTTDYKYGACTGRVVEHWHSGSMTTRVTELNRAVPGAYVELSEALGKKLGIKNGDSVIVESPRGKIELPAKLLDVAKATGGPRYDYVFVPWFDEFKLINMIMPDAFDPFSFQADYKMFAVKIYKGKTKGRQAEPGKVIL